MHYASIIRLKHLPISIIRLKYLLRSHIFCIYARRGNIKPCTHRAKANVKANLIGLERFRSK